MLRGALIALLAGLYGCAGALSVEAPPVAAPPAAPVEAPPIAAAAPVAPPEAQQSEALVGSLDGDLDDDTDDDDSVGSPFAASSPMLSLRDDELESKYKKDPGSIGSLSVGRPSAGLLINGVQMPQGPGWILLDPSHAWGTQETVDSIARSIDKVGARYPGTTALPIGHISAKNGGKISPHLSHQAGRDVDIAYYYRPGVVKQFIRGTEDNLDSPRSWMLVKTALKETPVEMIFIDSSIQRLLVDYALKNGEDPAFVDEVFQIRGKNARAQVRHIKGHANHLHIRFHSPVAEELGRRMARFLPKPQEPSKKRPRNAVANGGHDDAPPGSYAQVKARNGDTLVVWARRYGTTVEEIQRANALKGNALKIGVTYKIPQKAPVAPVKAAAKPAQKPAHGAVAKRNPPKPAPAGPTRGTSATSP